MTLNDALEGHSIKTTQWMHKGSLAALCVAVALTVTYARHNLLLAVILVLLCIGLVPVVYIYGKRLLAKVEQREMEARMLEHTQTYLQSASEYTPAVLPAPQSQLVESDIEIFARVIDGQKLPMSQEYRAYNAAAASPTDGYPVVFDALPRRYAIRTVYERRFADLASALPPPVALPLRELLPGTTADAFAPSSQPEALTVEYSSAVLNEIRIRAAEGYQRVRHGGVEVGGVLFGTYREGVVRIQALRPIPCQYSRGPRFVLSKQDEKGLVELLHRSVDDPELVGLEPAGWYHSHTREEIRLSATDVKFFNRFFPQAWQVAVVVRPTYRAPMRAGFFFRDTNGALTDQPVREFQLVTPASPVA